LIFKQQVVLVLELVSVYSPFTTRFKDYILRPLGPNTALKLHLAQRPALTTPLLRLISAFAGLIWAFDTFVVAWILTQPFVVAFCVTNKIMNPH